MTPPAALLAASPSRALEKHSTLPHQGKSRVLMLLCLFCKIVESVLITATRGCVAGGVYRGERVVWEVLVNSGRREAGEIAFFLVILCVFIYLYLNTIRKGVEVLN